MNNHTRSLSNYLNRMIVILISVVLITFSGCEADEPPQQLKIENSIIRLDFQDSIHSGATSDFDIEYLVSDPFIATIENNYIKGRHVGRTSVIVTSNNNSAAISIDVQSVFQLFNKPIQNYSNGKEHYLNKYEDLYYKDDSTLVFLQLNYEEEIAYYLQFNFTPQNTTESALFIFNQGVAQLAFNTLIENYEILDQTDTAYLFGNALDEDDITEIAIIEVDNENLLCYVYITQVTEQETTESLNKRTKSWQKLSKAKPDFSIQLK